VLFVQEGYVPTENGKIGHAGCGAELKKTPLSVLLSCGDRLIISAAGEERVWTVSAVNNQVVKYFDENGRYGQMPLVHLSELQQQNQVKIEPRE
jgi:hypothetical protein